MTQPSRLQQFYQSLGKTPEDRRASLFASAYLASGIVAVASLLLDPPQKTAVFTYDTADFSCPPDSRGPLQDKDTQWPYCQRGPWYWPATFPAPKR